MGNKETIAVCHSNQFNSYPLRARIVRSVTDLNLDEPGEDFALPSARIDGGTGRTAGVVFYGRGT